MYMTIKIVFIGIIVVVLVSTMTAAAYASGIRHDSGDDATAEDHGYWIDSYDSGFAGRYDKDRTDEYRENEDVYNYNWTWDKGCEDSTRTEVECNELINNPVKVDDF